MLEGNVVRISNGISALLALSYVAFVTPLAFAEEAGALKIDDLLAAREFDQLTVPALSPDEEGDLYGPWRIRAHRDLCRRNHAGVDTLYAKGLDLYAVNTSTGETVGAYGENLLFGSDFSRRHAQCRTLELGRLHEWFRELHLHPAPAYEHLADEMIQPGDVVITFNYDDSLERELRRAAKWDVSRGYGFPLGSTKQPSATLVLTLHGSINWLSPAPNLDWREFLDDLLQRCDSWAFVVTSGENGMPS